MHGNTQLKKNCYGLITYFDRKLENIKVTQDVMLYKFYDGTHKQDKATKDARFLVNSAAKLHNQDYAW
jgi:hypothetical protein